MVFFNENYFIGIKLTGNFNASYKGYEPLSIKADLLHGVKVQLYFLKCFKYLIGKCQLALLAIVTLKDVSCH